MPNWQVAISLANREIDPTLRLTVTITDMEWMVSIEHGNRLSWIRQTGDLVEKSGGDFGLGSQAPSLRDLRVMLARVEHRFETRLRRNSATIETNIPMGERRIRTWILGSL
ncbi:MAG: hypothetical protein QM831_11390 [Kofleriaceae bacterium]